MRIKKVSQPTPIVPGTAQITDTYSTSTDDGYSCNYVNSITEKNAISVNLNTGSSNTYASYSNGATLNITNTQNQVGSKFTVGSNGVIVGTGISKVKVQLNLEMRYTAATSKYYRVVLRKNGSDLSANDSVFVELHKQLGEVIAAGSGSKIIDVQAGDVLGLKFETSSGASDVNQTTGMYIEALE